MSHSATMTELNEEQQRAVDQIDGPLLVLAGAGSGKTRVVTFRIVNLIQHGIPPSKILGLTFTNKAADEMNQRVRDTTHCNVLISTFHSLGARILRESIHKLGYRQDFTIYDEEDSEKLLKTCVDKQLIAKKGDLKAFRSLISKAKNDRVSPDQIATGNIRSGDFCNAFSLYQARLKESGALDFDDLLYLTCKLFVEHPDVLEMYQDRWEYLLIDEYQDTNVAQYTMVRLLAAKRENICVVGDPDQSIYSWRGATISNILNFERDYPNAQIITLDQNYRSTSIILKAANAVINNNESRFDKQLWSDLGEGEKISLFQAYNDKEEAQFVMSKILEHHRRGVPFNEMVVFYRTNFQSRAFEDYMLYNGIPYAIVGGISFYHRREVKDILALLRMVQTGADLIAFARTINLPKRGIGPTTIEKISKEALSTGQTVLQVCKDIVAGASGVKVSAKQKSGIADYVHVINHITVIKEPLKDLVRAAIYDSGYLDYLKEEPDTYDDRKQNLDELISKAAAWESETQEGDLATFLSELALKSTLDETAGQHETLKLMTVHNGKGLEFNVAFLVGMEEDLFPHINSKGDEQAVEEERRLCYVGITRARQQLYITYARQRFMWGMLRSMQPSRFLAEIPPEFLQHGG